MSDERYPHTIDWAYTQRPDSYQGDPHEWVANYLGLIRHWAALEEHLAFMKRASEKRAA